MPREDPRHFTRCCSITRQPQILKIKVRGDSVVDAYIVQGVRGRSTLGTTRRISQGQADEAEMAHLGRYLRRLNYSKPPSKNEKYLLPPTMT